MPLKKCEFFWHLLWNQEMKKKNNWKTQVYHWLTYWDDFLSLGKLCRLCTSLVNVFLGKSRKMITMSWLGLKI